MRCVPNGGGRRTARRAEVLALELLAPTDALEPYLTAGSDTAELSEILSGTFGLPPAVAHAYAREVLPDRGCPSLLERLGLR
jgi:hypothetical protein